MNRFSKQSIAGYTLIEALVVIIMIAVLAAIAVPGWLTLLNRQRLNGAQDKALTVLRDAQVNAKRESRVWQACFQDNGTQVLWAIQSVPRGTNRTCDQAQNWESIIGGDSKVVSIVDTNTNLTKTTAGGTNYYGVNFNLNGWVDDALAFPATGRKVTFAIRNNPNGSKRCVNVATLLGAIRSDKDNNCN